MPANAQVPHRLIRMAAWPDDAAADPGNAASADGAPAQVSAETSTGKAWCRVRGSFAVAFFFTLAFLGVYYAGFWLRFEGEIGPAEARNFLLTAGWVVSAKLAIFLFYRLHHGWGRLVSFYDLLALVKASSASLLAVLLVDRFLLATSLIPRSIYILDWGATIVLVGGARAMGRGFRECAWPFFLASNQVPALIVGANEAGSLLRRAMIRDGNRSYRVIGFVDVDAGRQGGRIDGLPILGALANLWDVADRHGVQEIFVIKDALSGKDLREILEKARYRRSSVRVLPSYEQLLSGKVNVQPRSVAIEDLLRREPVALDMQSIRRWIDGRVLLVSGSAGSIGSEICRQLLQFSPKRLVLVDRSETGQFFLERELRRRGRNSDIEVCLADILDEHRMRAILEQHRPQVIFHAAAYKHVPLMEAHPGEAVKNIIVASRQMADLAAEYQSESFVMISTDKAVNPTSVMGACKRVAEMYVQSLTNLSPCRFITVRFGNVLDSAGSVVPIFRQQILEGGPVTVTHPDMRRFFMTIPEASQLVIQAGAIGRSGQILLLDMGEPVRIVDLATDMIELSGLRVGEDIAIEFTGLRPGEKLFEELRSADESQLPTLHPKIIVADHRPVDFDHLSRAIDRLETLARHAPDEVQARLEELVSEYRRARHPSLSLRPAA